MMAGSADYGLLDTAVPYKAAIAPIQGATYVNQLAAQQLQNQASNFEMQNALAEQAAYQRGGDIAQNLRAGGLGKQALEYEAKQSAIDSASLERANAKMSFARGLITDATTPDQFKAIMGGTYGDKDIGPLYAGMGMSADKMHQMVDEAAADPEKWRAFLPQAAMGMKAFQEHATARMNAQAGLMNAARGGQQLDIKREELGIKRDELGIKQGELDIKREAAEDKRAALAGDLSPKQIQELNANYPKAKLALRTFTDNADRILADIERLNTMPGLDNMLGYINGRTPTLLPESQAALELYNTIVARGGFKELTDLAAAGGKLGPATNTEHGLLQSSFGPIGRAQGVKSFVEGLNQAGRDTKKSVQRLTDAFDETYAYKAARAPAATSRASRTGGGNSAARSAYEQWLSDQEDGV